MTTDLANLASMSISGYQHEFIFHRHHTHYHQLYSSSKIDPSPALTTSNTKTLHLVI